MILGLIMSSVRILALVIVACAGLSPCVASGAAPSGYADLVRQVAPSVVTVLVEETRVSAGRRAAERASGRNDYDAVGSIIRRLLAGPSAAPGRGEGASSALGSGFIIRADGLIVTNRHVVAGARAVRVRFSDAREVTASVVGSDAVTDIALPQGECGHFARTALGVVRGGFGG